MQERIEIRKQPVPKYWTLEADGKKGLIYFPGEMYDRYKDWIKERGYRVVEITEEEYNNAGKAQKNQDYNPFKDKVPQRRSGDA